ncbi:intermembrane lipid transfer protein VPS13B isoform X3 [Pectinophora gossypiella]|uniref:intermembrane lipid transfer protein VPS13B isoform X3 n=1 Tax=Pectinophora gossypiella TaxID=13191 RepID=UPI00214E0739|nr:intermembrane lipid transfer protein VPS13B isoform X3 [Pectinophora gossypiella]
MFKIESYVTPILLSYVDKYVKDFRPADAQVSLWGGGVILHNLVLKTDVLQQEVSLPFTLVSGRIHELQILVPWTKIMSEPIVVTIDTIECILSLNPQPADKQTTESSVRRTQVVEAPPGYMQALVRRIVSNIAIKVQHLIVKYVQDDIVLSLNVKQLSIDSAGANWEPAFADIDQANPEIRRLVTLDDLTLCLDSSDSDGKIRFYQDPLLYRCKLQLRFLTRLVSANTRRASSISIQFRSVKLAWGVTNEQLLLLLRLLKEQEVVDARATSPSATKNLAKTSTASVANVLHPVQSNTAEPARSESWSEWAWSWMPSWKDREGGIEEAPMPAQPTPFTLSAYLDDISLALKLVESEGNTRKRFRNILELYATYAAVKVYLCVPTALRVKMGIRTLELKSCGKCPCGHIDVDSSNDELRRYLYRVTADDDNDSWKWPQDINDERIEIAEIADETTVKSEAVPTTSNDEDEQGVGQKCYSQNKDQSKIFCEYDTASIRLEMKGDEGDDLWKQMDPLIYVHYIHERSPPSLYTNPYENPPKDFEYSDWEEEWDLLVQLQPMEFHVCIGLIHRLASIRSILREITPIAKVPTMRTLTVEECDALLDNLPQQRINIDINDLVLRFHPWDHTLNERPVKTVLLFAVDIPKGSIVVTAPLYPHRVCSAAGQMPQDTGALWRGSRVNVTAAFTNMQAYVCSPSGDQRKPCARLDLRFVTHLLLYPQYFDKKQSVLFSYAIKIREANISGSAPRLYSAALIPLSLLRNRLAPTLRHTTVTLDALNDEDLVALDINVEDLAIRGYLTKQVTTHIGSLQAARATIFHSPGKGETKQAWLFSGPDVPTSSPYIRLAMQWCSQPFLGSMDFLGIWAEPTAVSIDPLFISWLSYRPYMKTFSDIPLTPVQKTISSSLFFKRRMTPPSSSGKGSSARAPNAEQVHVRAKSAESSSEKSEKKERKPPSPPSQSQTEPWWKGRNLLKLHERLRKVLITMELGLVLVYVTKKTASAVDCATMRIAMEQHVVKGHQVVVLSVGRWTMHTSSVTKHLWQHIQHDGPTYITLQAELDEKEKEESFPWKMSLADMSCYELAVITGITTGMNQGMTTGLKSQLKQATHMVKPRSIVEAFTSTVILSVAIKSLQHKIVIKKAEVPKHEPKMTAEETRMKFFTAGQDFRPTSLKEFLRGPSRRKRESSTSGQSKGKNPPVVLAPEHKLMSGAMISLGFNLHADTPPIVIRVEDDQVQLVSSLLHCFTHLTSLLRQNPLAVARQPSQSATGARLLNRSMSEIDEIRSLSESDRSENRSDLMTIFEAHPSVTDDSCKTFFWLQWVISRATLIVTTENVKLAFDSDDIITSIDIQEHYNQLKIKIGSASIKQYTWSEDDETWTTGAMGGRVLEVREPAHAQEDSRFLSLTITQAQISNLPPSWKEEMHPKLLEQKTGLDTMWEIYAIVAPLEVVILPSVLDNFRTVLNALSAYTYCPLPAREHKKTIADMPFCYLNVGGLRILMACDLPQGNVDDTFILSIGKISLNPHPDNPICRRSTTGPESGWALLTANLEGRQYEVFAKRITLQTARFSRLVSQEENEAEAKKGITGENPAHKWGQKVVTAELTTILHPQDVIFVMAPPLFVAGVLACGPAIELNLTSDCSFEFNVDQLHLILALQKMLTRTVQRRFSMEGHEDNIEDDMCPYAQILMNKRRSRPETSEGVISLNSDGVPSEGTGNVSKCNVSVKDVEVDKVATSDNASQSESACAATMDSGVETATSRSTLKSGQNTDITAKKSVSVAFSEHTVDASEHLEVFITMGMIELSLYAIDDGSELINELKPGKSRVAQQETEKPPGKVVEEKRSEATPETGSYKSLTDKAREEDMGVAGMNLRGAETIEFARKKQGNVPLFHLTFYQPNLYYWKRKAIKNIQVSLFNAWFGLGVGFIEGLWHTTILSTARGVPDPVTEIPPALVTMKYTSAMVGGSLSSTSMSNPHAICNIDIERPVLIELSADSIRRIAGIHKLMQLKLLHTNASAKADSNVITTPLMYRLRLLLTKYALDNVTIQISQVGVSGSEGTIGWDSGSLQLAFTARPDRVMVRGLINGLMIATGTFNEPRHLLLQPLQIGTQIQASWDAWIRAEGGLSCRDPIVRMNIDLDRITVELRPKIVASLNVIIKAIQEMMKMQKEFDECGEPNDDNVSCSNSNRSKSFEPGTSRATSSSDASDSEHHYYKDDLRSGAFKIISGGQLPMAYQVTLHNDMVAWRYPHPRAITRLLTFPLPDQYEEIKAVLEFFNKLLYQWEPHTYVTIPANDPKEFCLQLAPPDTVFATTWRFRIVPKEEKKTPYTFDINNFMPRPEPWCIRGEVAAELQPGSQVCAEQLSGILRVDSYFAPKLTPRVNCSLRFAALEIHVHNSEPPLHSHNNLEGYYVSKPLMRAHRVLTLSARDTVVNGKFGSPAGKLVLLSTRLSSDIMDCTSGTMEGLIDGFDLQGGVSLREKLFDSWKIRVCASVIYAALHVPRLRTLRALADDWQSAIQEVSDDPMPLEKVKSTSELLAETPSVLEGRISLWIYNNCSVALRVGQEGTDELIPLGSGIRLAYRWRNPDAVKRIRFAYANPTDWHWSNSIPFTVGELKIRLEDEGTINQPNNTGDFLYVCIEQDGAHRTMQITGRLTLASMLRLNLLYKVRALSPDNQWHSISSGELSSESIGRSVICSSSCDMVLKIRFMQHDTGWSGDIPLKECPKENVPWLVKVPSEGDVPYISVWCRVVRARADGRIFASIWPLYVLQSHLTLDTDVLVVTELVAPTTEGSEESRPPPLIQTASGRGTSTHLLAPGTTAARHNLSFQYRNIECPVTREAVPLHYGVTDTSVFEKRPPVITVDEVLQEIDQWLETSGRRAHSPWPYSVVATHWPGTWQPALLQPKCEVAIRYQAVRAGGGCSLKVQLSPVLLLCNASPISLTLRAHDAAPMCKLEPGTVISPPSIVLKKPFFMSVEIVRETFVSNQLEVCTEDPGRYGTPGQGQVAIDHPATFAIQCNQKVAIINLHYEIKEDINILGLTSAFVFVNNTRKDLLVAATAVPKGGDRELILRPKTFKLVAPNRPGSFQSIPLCKFWLRERWRGGNVSELLLFLNITLSSSHLPAYAAAPIRLGITPNRRPIALSDGNTHSMPVVVTQHKHEGRWVVTVADDPCPQFVIHNQSQTTVAVGQPIDTDDNAFHVQVAPECPDSQWYCTLPPQAVTHYSTPGYCSNLPPAPEAASPVPFLTFSMVHGEGGYPDWCPPVAVTDGEQLVQLTRTITVKLRVRTFPHSTLIEFRDVDQHDISASDIRRRLGEPLGSEAILVPTNAPGRSQSLDRIVAKAKYDNDETVTIQPSFFSSEVASTAIEEDANFECPEWRRSLESESERVRCMLAGVVVSVAAANDTPPLLALHVHRAACILTTFFEAIRTTISITDIQIDNLQYETGQFDFAVIATTCAEPPQHDDWPTLWNMFTDQKVFSSRLEKARVVLKTCHDTWSVVSYKYTELSEIEVEAGPLALYVEDAYVTALAELYRMIVSSNKANEDTSMAEAESLQIPLRLRLLCIHPLDLTLTLHTAVRMYIALDQSPLHLSTFKLQNMFTSRERLAHALTVHYLSAAILGAGWVVGGLELLGAPGALAARVGGATGGVKGIASAAAAALVRSLSAWAGSLARNLDLLAGDEEHARRAAAARRRPPDSLVGGLIAGITNFAINILGAVGGLAHHPLVGVAVGETESSTAALRRGILGALTKPLSATADLVAYAGHGLLKQTGWDPVPQPRPLRVEGEPYPAGWRRDSVRWTFRLAELSPLAGFEALVDTTLFQLLLTHKFIVVAEVDTERIVEMIDLRFCTLGPFEGSIVELHVKQRRPSRNTEAPDEDDEVQVTAAAMARVARYTGAEGTSSTSSTHESRVMALLPTPGQANALYAALLTAIHNTADTHFSLL